METTASAKVEKENKMVFQTKKCETTERKCEKSKYFENYSDLVKSLAKMGD